MDLQRPVLRALLLGVFLLVKFGRPSTIVFNGGFDNGLNGWTPFTTSNGTLGVGFPTVVPFNTDGTTNSSAAEFMVGQRLNAPGTWEGGGLMQNMVLPAGSLDFTLDIAALNSTAYQSVQGGQFYILIDMHPVFGYDLGSLASGQVVRNHIDFSFLGDGGQHSVGFEFLRPGVSSPYFAPKDFVDNFQISFNDVPTDLPEPKTYALMLSGLAALTFGWKRRRSP